MAFCPSCGKPITEGATFCGGCGASVAEELLAEAVQEPTGEPADEPLDEPASEPLDDTVVLSGCVACGSPLDEGVVFCGVCGASQAATAATQPFAAPIQPPLQSPFVPGFEAQSGYGQAPPPPPPPGYGGGYGPSAPSRKFNPAPISLAIILVTVVVAVLAFYLTTRGDGDAAKSDGSTAGGGTPTASTSGGASPTAPPGGSDVTAQVQSALAPVSESQAAANDAVKSLKATESSLQQVQAAGEDLSAAAQTAETAASQIVSSSDDEEATLQALMKALQAQQAYADTLAGLPGDPDKLTKTAATDIEKAGQLATDAYEGFANAAGPVSAAMAEGLTPPEAYSKVTTLARKIAKDKALKAYLVTIEGLMKQSGEGRDDVVKAISGVRGMSMNPTTAGGLIDAVYENRRAVLKKVKALRPPADARAKKIKTEFADALTYSLKADTAFAYWILFIHDYYYQEPEGYQGHVPLNADYRGAVTWSGKASAAKGRLVKVYNKIAKQYGLKHTWAAQDI